METQIVFFTILGMALVTYLPRALPLLLLSSRNLPPLLGRWLGNVPAAVLAAMLAPALVSPGGSIDLSFGNLFLWAAVPTFLLAWRTRSIFGTVVLGMALVAMGRFF